MDQCALSGKSSAIPTRKTSWRRNASSSRAAPPTASPRTLFRWDRWKNLFKIYLSWCKAYMEPIEQDCTWFDFISDLFSSSGHPLTTCFTIIGSSEQIFHWCWSWCTHICQSLDLKSVSVSVSVSVFLNLIFALRLHFSGFLPCFILLFILKWQCQRRSDCRCIRIPACASAVDGPDPSIVQILSLLQKDMSTEARPSCG